MAVEVRPLGVKCNIQCQYCYQNPQRDAGNVAKEYDLGAMKEAITREGGPFVLFGGEPLLMPEDDLEALWKWGYERYGANRIQTNAVLINDRHVRMFRDYGVHVGISVDGPDQLNDARWTATLDHTRRATANTHRAIERLCKEGLTPTLIVTLHRGNATTDKLPRMREWFRAIEALGVRDVRLHILEVESGPVRDKYALSNGEVLEALAMFMRFEADELGSLRFDLFGELRNLLLGRDDTTSCVWSACDPYTTEAVRGIEGHGQSSNCGRTNKDGIDFAKADHPGFERALALYRTEQSANGCKDCRFFLMCKGQCPGTAADGDWRNRSDYCAVWMGLFERIEAELLAQGFEPISLSPDRERLEAHVIACWRAGHNTNIAQALKSLDDAPADSPSAPGAPAPVRGVRVSWVSAAARAAWEDRLTGIAATVADLSWQSVAHGLRRCSIESVAIADMAAALARWQEYGLTAQSIGIEFFAEQPYFCRRGGGADEVARVRFVVGRAVEDVAACKSALACNDHRTVGDLLGYPSCCAQAYAHAAGSQSDADPIWRMAIATVPADLGRQDVEPNGPCQANVICRPLGIHAVPHLPCSFACGATAELGRRFIVLGRRLGRAAEMDWLVDFLDMPMDWSSLHGIAQVRMPLLKMVAPTAPLAILYRVRRSGSNYPDEGGVGLSFPFKPHRGTPLTRSRGYRRGLQNPIEEPDVEDISDRLATDNGFPSLTNMEVAHQPIVDLAGAVLAGKRGSIVDLGCGNGLLLKRICAANPGLVPFGIDRDPDRIRGAHALLPRSRENFIAGDLFDDPRLWTASRRYACAILMAARLLEVEPERAALLRCKLQSHCDTVLVYAYPDAIKRWGMLDTIARKAGLRLRDPDQKASMAYVDSH